jgi:hypothetical protein
MFQTLNWDLWFNDQQSGDPSPSDDLVPFHIDTQGNTYNSEMTRDWTKLNYQYDVLVPRPAPTGETGAEGLVQPVMEAQGILAPQAVRHEVSQPARGTQGLLAPQAVRHEVSQPPKHLVSDLKRTLNSRYGNTRKDLFNAPSVDGRKNDYIINIVYDRCVSSFPLRPILLFFVLG